VLIAGVVIGLFMPEMPGARLAANVPTLPIVLVLVPVLVGLFVRRRGWVASSAALLVGVALWVALYLRPSPPWAPSDNWNAETWAMFVARQIIPWTLVAAVLGAAGSWMSRAYSSRFLSSR